MHRKGHYGMALLTYAPVAFVLLALELSSLALLGGGVVVGGAMLPDLDMRLPGVRHRGPTHTVWFALAVGAVTGLAGAVLSGSGGVLTALAFGVFGVFVGTLAVLAHLLADALTPMGVRPLEPVDDRKYCFDVAKAANPLANYGLLALGVIVAGVAAAAGLALGS